MLSASAYHGMGRLKGFSAQTTYWWSYQLYGPDLCTLRALRRNCDHNMAVHRLRVGKFPKLFRLSENTWPFFCLWWEQGSWKQFRICAALKALSVHHRLISNTNHQGWFKSSRSKGAYLQYKLLYLSKLSFLSPFEWSSILFTEVLLSPLQVSIAYFSPFYRGYLLRS